MLLRRGTIHEWNSILQQQLRLHGYNLAVDGIFGYGTDAAIRDFQEKNNLVPDGIVGHATWSALKTHYLKDSCELKNEPLEAPIQKEVSGLFPELINMHNCWGNLLYKVSEKLDISMAALMAVIAVESNGTAFLNNKIIIRFENHVFARQPGISRSTFNQYFKYSSSRPWEAHKYKHPNTGTWLNSHIWPKNHTDGPMVGNQDNEWTAFELAKSINMDAAMQSISMGLPQMMGFNHQLLGYASAADMFNSFQADNQTQGTRAQILGMMDFIVGVEPESPMLSALRRVDFVSFARYYNGTGKSQEYGSKIESVFKDVHTAKLHIL
jgi:hypothetical protein